MTESEWRAFVSEGTRTGKLATVRPDGRPHLAPVWFVLDGDDVVFNTGRTSVKGRNLAHENRVSLCVDSEVPPFSFVVIEGHAEVSEDLEPMLHWARRIGARYMGEDKGAEFGKRNAVPGELLVRIHISKVIAQKNVAD
ncbi:MAG: PPOX class F420-dependent oxidoreductase [Streptosporangiaceae bacterium]